MTPSDPSFERLIKTAAAAPQPAPDPLPFHLEARVLAQWRSLAREDEFTVLVRLFRRAVVCASVVMILSIVWSHREKPNPAASVLALANYEINTHLPP